MESVQIFFMLPLLMTAEAAVYAKNSVHPYFVGGVEPILHCKMAIWGTPLA